MGGNTNYPTGLDDDASLYDVQDNVTAIAAAHHNNIKEAVKALERLLGINSSAVASSIVYQLLHASDSHPHDGVRGQLINPTTVRIPSGGFPAGGFLYDHLMNATLHNPSAVQATGIATMLAPNLIRVPSQAILRATGIATWVSQSDATALLHVPSEAIFRATGIASIVSQSAATILMFVPTQVPRHLGALFVGGSLAIASALGFPLSFGRTMQIEAVRANLRVGPSGATTAVDVRFGPTSLWAASPGLRPIFPAGATDYGHASPNLVTYPSGAIITIGSDAVGSNDPGQDLSVSLVFRE